VILCEAFLRGQFPFGGIRESKQQQCDYTARLSGVSMRNKRVYTVKRNYIWCVSGWSV